MKITTLVFIIIHAFQFVFPAVTVFPVKIGETLVLDIGREVREWKRVRNGVEESIKACTNSENVVCGVWTSTNSKVKSDGREQMNNNGTLVIRNFQEADSGDYFSNDELERVHYTSDGQIWKLAKSRISVFALN